MPIPEMRIQRLENQLRQLTGQNEELQYRNRQLEERLRQLEGGAQVRPARRRLPSPTSRPLPPAPSRIRRYRQQPPHQQAAQPSYEQPQIAAPAPIVQEPAVRPARRGTRRRGDAFDPEPEPECPGRAARARRRTAADACEAPVGAPGGRGAGEPLDLANTGSASAIRAGCAAGIRRRPALRRQRRA